MAKNATLKATLRDETGKGAARRMRSEGRIPAVMYGRGEETRALSVDAHDFEMLVKKHSLDTTLIELSVDGLKGGSIRALVSELQTHPYKPQVLHVDFQQIHAGERVTVEVPIRLQGTPEGVRAGGVLQHVLHTVELECVMEEIPEALEVDVSALEIGESVHISDMAIPEGVEVLIEDQRTIATVAAPTVLEVPEEEEDVEAPELVGAEAAEAEEGAEEEEGAEPAEEE